MAAKGHERSLTAGSRPQRTCFAVFCLEALPRAKYGSSVVEKAANVRSRALNCGIVEATTGKTRGHQVPKRPNTPYKTKHYKGWDGLGPQIELGWAQHKDAP
eukprot:scaffold19207_cov81-Phaeocystis_antarctica.AAC.2